jgi:hypothetical protein
MEAKKMSDVVCEVRAGTGLITLNRPRALNALSLDMIRQLTAALLAWRDDPGVMAVAIRGQGRDAANPSGGTPFGNFSAGGDIRFFHQAVLAGDPALEDFFTEEYELNFLVDTFPKPYLAFLDGIDIRVRSVTSLRPAWRTCWSSPWRCRNCGRRSGRWGSAPSKPSSPGPLVLRRARRATGSTWTASTASFRSPA